MKWMKKECDTKQLTFTMGKNQFSILTLEEFKQYYLNLLVPSEVPTFEFDLNKAIKDFMIADEKFINKFFDIDLDWGTED